MKTSLAGRAASEFLGTAFLLAAILGSGIMAERLAAGNVALALLCNSLATGGALAALILTFRPFSGAHFNPAVSLTELLSGSISWREAAVYVAAQIAGGAAGAALANAMFALPVINFSRHARTGAPLWIGEIVATFGLVLVIRSTARFEQAALPFAVAAYIVGAYWFTSSTSFANPAVTIARMLSDTFAGIRPADAPGFIVAQLIGCFAAVMVLRWLNHDSPAVQTPGT